ncbi:xanthine dehydrogenase family protein subunit M, partial [Pseudomonas syringae]|nr:xanthine dehydrogenase family protein subunit M [Pseudomonas syringae]
MRTFDYARAASPAQAVTSASGQGQRFYLAGGTTLLDLVKLDVMQPEQL